MVVAFRSALGIHAFSPPELIYVSKLTCKLQRRKQWTGAFGTDVPEADCKPGAVATTVLVTGPALCCVNTCLCFWKHPQTECQELPNLAQGERMS